MIFRCWMSWQKNRAGSLSRNERREELNRKERKILGATGDRLCSIETLQLICHFERSEKSFFFTPSHQAGDEMQRKISPFSRNDRRKEECFAPFVVFVVM
jgi:hypothetical protein